MIKHSSLIRNKTRIPTVNTAVKHCFGDTGVCNQTRKIIKYVTIVKKEITYYLQMAYDPLKNQEI